MPFAGNLGQVSGVIVARAGSIADLPWLCFALAFSFATFCGRHMPESQKATLCHRVAFVLCRGTDRRYRPERPMRILPPLAAKRGARAWLPDVRRGERAGSGPVACCCPRPISTIFSSLLSPRVVFWRLAHCFVISNYAPDLGPSFGENKENRKGLRFFQQACER